MWSFVKKWITIVVWQGIEGHATTIDILPYDFREFTNIKEFCYNFGLLGFRDYSWEDWLDLVVLSSKVLGGCVERFLLARFFIPLII